jgi:hypothetical protein
MANPIKLHHKRPKGPSWNKVVPHHILLSNGERIGVVDLRAFIGNKIRVGMMYNLCQNWNTYIKSIHTYNFIHFEFFKRTHIIDLGLNNKTSYINHEYVFDSYVCLYVCTSII